MLALNPPHTAAASALGIRLLGEKQVAEQVAGDLGMAFSHLKERVCRRADSTV